MIYFFPAVFVLASLIVPGLGRASGDSAGPAVTTIYKVADPDIELDNGRRYILKNGTVIEEIEFNTQKIQRNIFDFENGVVYHERPDGAGASYATTPFAQLPEGRAAEVQALSCRIAGKSGLVVRRKDDVAYYREKYCGTQD